MLDPLGLLIGLNGVILLAYIVAIPANEIVIPTVLMLTVLVTGVTRRGAGRGRDVRAESDREPAETCSSAGGWTLLTGVNLMLFSLLHNPCSTTIYTIYKETGQRQMDDGRRPAAAGAGLCRHLPGGAGVATGGGRGLAGC